MSFKAASREFGAITVIDLEGRITLGEGSGALHALVRETLDKGVRKIVVNLAGVNYIDSSGLGELVSLYRAVKQSGGELKLLSVSRKVSDLLQVTKLYTVFDIHNDEASVLASFRS